MYFTLLSRRSKDLNVELDDTVMRDIETALSDSRLQKAIRNCFYISTAISPLVMLNPRQYGKDEFKVESLVPVSHHCTWILLMLMQID
jgi:hypothetical protein